MIFKSPGDYHVHKLRVIHLYEADLNLFFAVKWRITMARAERHHALNSGQYGGQQGSEAQFVALAKELKNDITILSRRPTVTFDNDATSCYDQIIPAFASLAN